MYRFYGISVSGNEEAIGLDMLQHPARKKEANLAKESGEYTIAGPFELAQGGTGVLLFNPIYITDDTNQSSFWGFSILVINWERFLEEIHMDRLEEASFEYRIWKKRYDNRRKNYDCTKQQPYEQQYAGSFLYRTE